MHSQILVSHTVLPPIWRRAEIVFSIGKSLGKDCLETQTVRSKANEFLRGGVSVSSLTLKIQTLILIISFLHISGTYKILNFNDTEVFLHCPFTCFEELRARLFLPLFCSHLVSTILP